MNCRRGYEQKICHIYRGQSYTSFPEITRMRKEEDLEAHQRLAVVLNGADKAAGAVDGADSPHARPEGLLHHLNDVDAVEEKPALLAAKVSRPSAHPRCDGSDLLQALDELGYTRRVAQTRE